MPVKDFNYMSQALMHPTTVKVVLPETNKIERSLYFLHGVLCDAVNCLENLNVQELADEYNMALIIPDGGNSFYVDHGVAFGNYGRFVGNELVEITRRAFKLPADRKHTIIAGFSMGGYGAIRNGMKYYQNFGTIIGMSSACLYEKSAAKIIDGKFGYFKKMMFDKVFKEKAKPGEFSENYKYLIEENIKKSKPMPKIYLVCGTNEELVNVNDEFTDYLKCGKVEYEYVKTEGKHDWSFWSKQLEPAIKWTINNSETNKGI